MGRKIEFNVTGKERGLLAKAIGEFLGVEVRYLRVPTYNYHRRKYTSEVKADKVNIASL